MQGSVIVGSFDPIDFGDFHERDLASALDDYLIQISWRALAAGDSLLGSTEGEIESGIIERLQEVVEGAGFEGAQGVLVVGGDKDNSGRQISAQQFEDVKAVAF